MKVILDIDNDWVVAFATITGLNSKQTEEVKQFLSEKDFIEVGMSDLGEDSVQSMKMLGASLVLAKIGNYESK
jgi:hypothetical protein